MSKAAAVPVRPRPVLKWIKASALKSHPKNWRFHPDSQKRGVKSLLDTVGWAGVILMNKTTGRVVDGHLRKGLVNGDEEVPVLVGEWTEEEEALILATLDPIAAEAESDRLMYRQLTEELTSDSGDVNSLIDQLRGLTPKDKKEKSEKENLESNEAMLHLRPKEHYDYIVVLAQSLNEWNQLCELLGLSTRPRGGSKLGFGRGIRASDLIERLAFKEG